MNYMVTIEEDPETGDLILPIPDELAAEMGWKVGDTLLWTIHDNGTVSLKKTTTEPEPK